MKKSSDTKFDLDRINRLKKMWLERRFLKITFSEQEDDPEVDILEIQQLLIDEEKEIRS